MFYGDRINLTFTRIPFFDKSDKTAIITLLIQSKTFLKW